TCAGGKEKCDRRCIINVIQINGKSYPFGGACNRYVNLLHNRKQPDTVKLDLVQLRERLVYQKYGRERGIRLLPPNGKKVAVNRSLLTNTLFPLYYNFFTALGFEVLCSEEIDPEGMERRGAEFCYPVEIAHGALMDSINKHPDYYFLPHVGSMPVENGIPNSVTCPFVQAEPYYLKAAFDELKEGVVLSPVLDFSKGYEEALESFLELGRTLGFPARITRKAFSLGVRAQIDFHRECQEMGRLFLEELEQDPAGTAIVLFGRPYNAFTKIANMGIPQKFATRGYRIIPYDFLPFGAEEPDETMFWAMGQMILKAARLVQHHPQLFATYITNFSCGPDSFVVGFFRDTMGQKPSLTLELDSHTADAGLDTRIEAFLDIIQSFREINRLKTPLPVKTFRPARVVMEKDNTWVESSAGRRYPLNHPRVHVLIPSMGDLGSRMLAATLRHLGIKASAVPPPSAKELKTGKGYTSCKECLPLLLTVGSLFNHLENRANPEELLVYFMPTSPGPCRFGQYNVLIKRLIEKMQIEDVAQISLTCDNGYAGLGTDFSARAWQAVVISDVLDDIYSAVLTIARDKKRALATYKDVCEGIIASLERDSWKGIKETLRKAARTLRSIERKQSLEHTPKVALVGEIYVRRDGFSRQYLVERLAEHGIIVNASPIAEWIYYCDYLQKTKNRHLLTGKDRLGNYILQFFKISFERTIKGILSQSGFYKAHMVDVERLINNASGLINPRLTVETILTAGAAITEIVDDVAGVISIGPFGCMPSRIAEAVLNFKINEAKLETAKDKNLVARIMEDYPALPFLSVETDGNTFPQVIEARLEVFCMQVERVHRRLLELKGGFSKRYLKAISSLLR
ncbi:MAG TPA: acyl-CoA dehydratase activase-related protein, partial [Bacillota bacterium]|nr:acyl-CoA dehydratase activase-related protein [Bacillota bacterium]